MSNAHHSVLELRAAHRYDAAHDWDMAVALAAGCAAAFIARPGKVLNPLMPEPDIVGNDLLEVAEKIAAVDAD